jgi:hypothetical protein
MAAQDEEHVDEHGPPWPLSRGDIDAFSGDGLTPVCVELHPHESNSMAFLWRAEYERLP